MPRKQARKAKHSRAAGSARSSAKSKPRGRPFKAGNPYRWQPGESGNPAGSSRKQILSAAYRDILAQPMPLNLKEHIAQMIADGAPVAEVIGWAMAAGALKGDTRASVELRKATEMDVPKNVDGDSIDGQLTAQELTDEELIAILAGDKPAE